ncbi:MAG: hypothetical protein ACO36A_00870 [Ilumatobacteraceae bacterium]
MSAVVLSVALGTAPRAPAATADDTGPTTTIAWRIERDPSECIGFLPKPDCGYAPQDAGERGGALQVTLFFVMIGAVGVIGSVVVRNVVRRDRAIAAGMARADDRTG